MRKASATGGLLPVFRKCCMKARRAVEIISGRNLLLHTGLTSFTITYQPALPIFGPMRPFSAGQSKTCADSAAPWKQPNKDRFCPGNRTNNTFCQRKHAAVLRGRIAGQVEAFLQSRPQLAYCAGRAIDEASARVSPRAPA